MWDRTKRQICQVRFSNRFRADSNWTKGPILDLSKEGNFLEVHFHSITGGKTQHVSTWDSRTNNLNHFNTTEGRNGSRKQEIPDHLGLRRLKFEDVQKNVKMKFLIFLKINTILNSIIISLSNYPSNYSTQKRFKYEFSYLYAVVCIQRPENLIFVLWNVETFFW